MNSFGISPRSKDVLIDDASDIGLLTNCQSRPSLYPFSYIQLALLMNRDCLPFQSKHKIDNERKLYALYLNDAS